MLSAIRYLLLAIVPGFAIVPCAAQNRHVIDSLKQLLQAPQTDTMKYRLYGTLSWEYFIGSRSHTIDTAKLYADSIMMLAEKTGNDYSRTFAHFYYGLVDRKKQHYHDAIGHFQQYINYRVSIGDSLGVAKGLYQLGVVYNQLGNNTKSLATYYRALAIYKESNFVSGYVQLLNTIGVVLKNIRNYDEAINVYNEALTILDTLEDMKIDKANVLGNMANAYAEKQEYHKAKALIQEALVIDTELNDFWAIAMDYEHIGNVLLQTNQYDSALHYQLKALKLRRDVLSGKADLATSHNKVGFTYFKTGQLDEAKTHLNTALALAKELNSSPLLRDIYLTLSQLHAARQDFRKAYEYDQLYKTLHDSLLNENIAQQLNELHTRFESEKKDHQIALLAKENVLQENETQRQQTMKRASLIGLALVSLLGVMIGYSYRQKLRNQKLIASKDNEIMEANFRRQLSDLEMKALRAQINPHFLFNCLNSINRMILENENDKASQYLAKFSKLVRLILENSETPNVSLHNELSLIESYIQLEELRFSGRIGYHIQVDESVDRHTTSLPSMVLQPFVENAIWHGLIHQDENTNGIVDIRIHKKDGKLYCIIEDNGVGRERAQLLANQSVLKTKSLGIKISKDRLRLMSDHDQEFINIIDLKDDDHQARGTRVEINFPLEQFN